MEPNLFNVEEIKKMNWLLEQVGELNQKVAKLQLELNNLKVDIKKERMARQNGM